MSLLQKNNTPSPLRLFYDSPGLVRIDASFTYYI